MDKLDINRAKEFHYYNKLLLKGQIVSPIKENDAHFRNFFVRTIDKAGNRGDFRLYMPLSAFKSAQIFRGDFIFVDGEMQSWSVQRPNGFSRLVVSCFSTNVRKVAEEQTKEDNNRGTFVGYLCKKPFIKHVDGVSITESTLAITNFKFNKNYYLPFIVCGDNAQKLKNECDMGDRIAISGAIQERKYPKTLDDGKVIMRSAVEISAHELEILK